MEKGQRKFQQRLDRLACNHDALSRGYVIGVRHDGFIVARPRPAASRISGRSVLLLLVVFFLFKGFLFASVGTSTYTQRIAHLRDGNVLEKAGAFVMQADPVSRAVAAQLRPILR